MPKTHISNLFSIGVMIPDKSIRYINEFANITCYRCQNKILLSNIFPFGFRDFKKHHISYFCSKECYMCAFKQQSPYEQISKKM